MNDSLTSVGVSNYYGVVTSFKHRFAGRSQGLPQTDETYGRAFDEGSNGFTEKSLRRAVQSAIRLSRGSPTPPYLEAGNHFGFEFRSSALDCGSD